MSNNQLTYTISLIEKITAPARKINEAFKKMDANANKARATTRRLPLNIADLRGELSALDQKKSFAKTTTQVRHLNGVIQKTEKRLRKLENLPPKGFISRIKQASTAIAGISLKDIGIVYATRQLIRFGSESAKLYDIQEKADAQLRSSLLSTGYTAGKTFGQLKQAASALQGKSLFGDEEINNAQAMLLTFTKIRGEVYDRTTPAILDLTQKMGGTLKGSVVQLGKALNDPKRGLAELSRAGITFTEKQKEGIYGLVDAGKLQEAQMLILDELYTQFGGAAEAAAKAGLGPAQQMTMAWKDLREKIGGLVANIVQKVTPPLKKMFEFLNGNFDKTLKWIKLGTVVIAGFYTALKVSNVVSKIWSARLVVMRLMAIRTSHGVKGLTRSLRMMNIATKANVIGALVGVVVSAIAYFKIFKKKTDDMRVSLDKATEAGANFYATNSKYLDEVFSALDKTNPKSKERLRLVDELLKRFPNLNKEMRDELINTNNLASSKAILIEQLKQEAITRGMQSVLQEKASQLAKAQLEKFEEDKENEKRKQMRADNIAAGAYDNIQAGSMLGQHQARGAAIDLAFRPLTVAAKKVAQLQAEMKSAEDYLKANMNGMFSGSGGAGGAEDAGVQNQLNTITGGGRSMKNIVINLDSLIRENTNIFKEGDTVEDADDFLEKLTTSLQLVVNDTNMAV